MPGRRGNGGRGDAGTRGRGDAGTRGRGDAGTRGRGDAGTRGRGDAGTRGRGDAGTRGRGDAGTRERGVAETRERRDTGDTIFGGRYMMESRQKVYSRTKRKPNTKFIGREPLGQISEIYTGARDSETRGRRD